jgi:ISXO2-like transposase domain
MRGTTAASGSQTSTSVRLLALPIAFVQRHTPLADVSAASLHPFVADHVEPGATVITDAWQGYHGIAGLGYAHERRSQRAAGARGDDPVQLLPAVHRSPHWPSGGCWAPTRGR